MFQAKRSGLGTLVYDPEHDEFSRARLALAEELRHGLERGQLVVWYQPQVEVATGAVCCVEALVRWRHPTQGLLAPGAFLPAARRAGLMPRLTEVVLATAVRDLARLDGPRHRRSLADEHRPAGVAGRHRCCPSCSSDPAREPGCRRETG